MLKFETCLEACGLAFVSPLTNICDVSFFLNADLPMQYNVQQRKAGYFAMHVKHQLTFSTTVRSVKSSA
jgi:hypothetical protein